MNSNRSHFSKLGWIMFTLSGLFFLVQAIRLGDWLTGAGAVAWLVGVAFFVLD